MRSEKRRNWRLFLRSKQAPSQHQVQVQVLDTTTFNGESSLKESVLDVCTYLIQLKLVNTLISPAFTHQEWSKTLTNEEALRLLKTRLLVGRGKKANLAGFSVTNSRKKGRFNANFAGIFRAHFAEKLSVKTG